MERQVCETCHWCGEPAGDGVGRLRCELHPRGQYVGLLNELAPAAKETFLEIMGAPVTPGWGCGAWVQRSPAGAPPRRTEGL